MSGYLCTVRMGFRWRHLFPWLLLLLISCAAVEIPLAVEQLPTITSENKRSQIVFTEDDDFRDFPIKCEASGNPPPVYAWTKNGQLYDPFTDPNVKSSPESGTFIIQQNGNMATYNGTYRCYASNKLGTAISEETDFIVPGVLKFPNEHLPPIVVEEGAPVVLRCDPPTEMALILMYWMTVDMVHIRQDERVTLGQDGNLYFANVIPSDSRTDYCCYAKYSSVRRIQQKLPMTLSVLDSPSPKERRPRLLMPQGTRSIRTVLRGEVLMLECIAEGLPTPQISWLKEDEELISGRAVTENYGRVLTIKEASEEDQGSYQCVAHNRHGSAHHEFQVQVEERPGWKEKPESSVWNVGSRVELRCSAYGNPEPEITWKRNGIPLEQATLSPNHQVMDGEIVISNLRVSDSAVYQCEARNKHGGILANANINVLDIPPVIMTPDNRKYTAVRGHSVVLYCDVFAYPSANVYWNREESVTQLQGDRYNMYENGTLEILNTEAEDAGNYMCWVTNTQGKTALTAELALLEPTRVSLSPENLVVLRSNRLTLTCQVHCDTDLLPSLKVTWRKDGQKLSGKSKRVHIQSDTLSIPSVTLEDGGTYSCTAHTSLDGHSAETLLTVQDVPRPPELLHLSDKQGHSVKLSWTPSDDHNSPITEFITEVEKSHQGPGEWEYLLSVPGNVTSIVVPLAPYFHYRFRVIAINAIGRSLPSAASDRYSTPPAVPDRNPQILHVEAEKPNELTVKWEPLSHNEHNGPGLEYRISWRLQGVETEWHHEQVKQHQFTIKDTPPFAPYDIFIQAVNEMGAGPEPQVHTKYSGEDTPDAAPHNLDVEVLNSTLARVTWTGITQDRVRGHLSGYKVIYQKSRSLVDGKRHHAVRHVLTFPGQKDSGIIPGLTPFSEYHVSVAAYNTQGDGPASTPVLFQTPEGVPEKPHFLRIMNSDENSLTLSWGPPRKVNGILTSYVLQYQIINDTDEIGTIKNINITNPSTVSCRIPQLHGGTKYKFYLRACTSTGCGGAVSEEGLTVTQATYAVAAHGLSTQGWFIGLLCAVALLTLTLLIACFVQRNKGGKYAVKEKEELPPEVEAPPVEDELFGDDCDKKPLNRSLDSLSADMKSSDSDDSLAQYSDGEHRQFNEDGSFIGAYIESKERGPGEAVAGHATLYYVRS
ncbi:neural cell adhesion molecule L1-like protein isoform 2-T5 [Discoglossus pictus]